MNVEHWMFGYIGVAGVHACQVGLRSPARRAHGFPMPAITVGITLVIGAAGEPSLPNASATAPPTTTSAHANGGVSSTHHAHGRLRGGVVVWTVPAIYSSYLGQAGSGRLLVHPGGFRRGGDGCWLVPRGGFWPWRSSPSIWVVGPRGWQLPIPIGQGILTVVVLVV